MNVDLDHTVVTVSDWERSNAFYRDVLGAEVVPRGPVVAYRFGDRQLNVHGPGFDAFPLPLHEGPAGSSDICFVWDGPIEAAVAHLAARGVSVEGELGCLGSLESGHGEKEDGHGTEGKLSHDQLLTDPDEAERERHEERDGTHIHIGKEGIFEVDLEGRGMGIPALEVGFPKREGKNAYAEK